MDFSDEWYFALNTHFVVLDKIELFSQDLHAFTLMEKKVNYLDALEDETGAVSGGSSFTLGLAD